MGSNRCVAVLATLALRDSGLGNRLGADARIVSNAIVAGAVSVVTWLTGATPWPQATFAATIQEEPEALLISREVDGGVAKLRVKLPAVVTVDLRIVAPTSVYSLKTARTFKYNDGVRFAALPAIMAAKKKPLTEVKLADLAADTALKVHYGSFQAPPARKAGIKVKDVAELVSRLKDEAKAL